VLIPTTRAVFIVNNISQEVPGSKFEVQGNTLVGRFVSGMTLQIGHINIIMSIIPRGTYSSFWLSKTISKREKPKSSF